MLSVFYDDNHLLVVEKPAGIPSQPDRSGDLDALTMGKQIVKERYNKPGAVFLGLVHRLDRPASGVMVFARTSKSASRLSEQFRDKTIRKTYLALVKGAPVEGEVLEDYLLKDRDGVRVVEEGSRGARRARLQISTVKRFGKVSLVEIILETGRAHQIRVQLSSRGFPLVGDFRYGSRQELDGKNLALHAGKLELNHPTKKDRMFFVSMVPLTWPPDVQDAGNRLLGL